MSGNVIKVVAAFNLLTPTRKPLSFAEKIYNWAIFIGKYIVIGTEVIVLAAFAARFKLDYDISDLTDNIEEKASQIAAFQDKEKTYRQLLEKIDDYKNLTENNKSLSEEISRIETLTPSNIEITSLSLQSDDILIEGVAPSIKDIESYEDILKRQTRSYHTQNPNEKTAVWYESVSVENTEIDKKSGISKFSLKLIRAKNGQ